MSGFTSPYEEENPFADMPGSGPVATNPVVEAAKTASAIIPEPVQEPTQPVSIHKDAIESREYPTTPMRVPAGSKTNTGSRRSSHRKLIRAAAVTSRLEKLDIDGDPLGPLGGINDPSSPPLPPLKDPPPQFDTASLSTPNSKESGAHKPSIPVTQAANPTFNISVGDPTKIGDITSAHTVYKVSTKTTSHAYKQPEFSVTRRYRDFLWLYDQLNRNCPGTIVPPPPEKQAVGRFSDNFIEARRFALERMLEKVAKHPVLRGDADFKLFLESESFSNDVKARPIDNRAAHETSRGFLGLGSAFTIQGKFIESDEYFDIKKAYFDELEHELKGLSKAVDVVIRQRKDLALTTSEFGAALSALSTVELSRSLSNALGSLSDLQTKIQELHDRQAQQDLMTLGHTVDEYIRLISSVKQAFSCRQKSWLSWQAADAESAKRKSTGDKIRNKARTQQDRLNLVDAEMTESERRANQLKIDFDNVSKVLKAEIKRFESDKVEDFKASVEVFLESAVEGQKEIIEHWEFYLDLIMKDLDDDLEPETSNATDTTAEASVAQDIEHQEVGATVAAEPATPSTGIPSSPATTQSEPPSAIPHHEANPFAQPSDL